MESESSAIARKLQNILVLDNAVPRKSKFGSQYTHARPYVQEKEEPGIFKNILLITLMGAAVLFTQMSLILVKWTKRLEG